MQSGSDRSIILSKFMSFVLRHKPQNFGLVPDQHGFVRINDLLTVLKNRYENVHASDIEKVVQSCPKRRFEIRGENIRARYGHSIDVVPDEAPCQPPDCLYHGTSPAMKQSILTEGIKPESRRFVHLSKTSHEALQVGKRKSKNPMVFTVNAKEAHRQGIRFYDMGLVVLTEGIPAEHIRFSDQIESLTDQGKAGNE
jgi:putative RNA 2'-phosphotransferase